MERTIAVSELREALAKTDENIALLDIRRKADYDADQLRLPDATWYDPEQIDQWITTLPKDKDIVVYCVRGGSVSNSVVDRLHKENIPARYISGGIEAWKAAGGATEDKEE